jgi:hypothetical protein
MKPKSLVECVVHRDMNKVNPVFRHLVKKLYVKGDTYLVRELVTCKVTGDSLILLEDFVIGYNSNGEELAGDINDFRELILPPSFEEELEEVILASECIC